MNSVKGAINKYKIIVILRDIQAEKIIPVTEALYDGGIRLIEVTFNQNSRTHLNDTGQAIKEIIREFKNRMYVGAGTVLTPDQLEAAKQSGAEYIISPNLDLNIVRRTLDLGMLSIPGALTPSEIVSAFHHGAAFVKVFPGGVLGIPYFKALRAPLRHIPLLVVGGVDKTNLPAFLQAGVDGFGIGNGIADQELIKANDYQKITQLAKDYTMLIEAL